MAEGETLSGFFERVISALFSVEQQFGTPAAETKRVAEAFAGLMVENYVMPGTPLLTNAGRNEAALSSCVVLPFELRAYDAESERTICAYYRQNMGAGFDFTPYKDPLALLCWLNELCVRESATGLYDRYIGNMGMLHISHPCVAEFSAAKRWRNLKHFNISIDVSEAFMQRAQQGESFELANRQRINAAELLRHIAEHAWLNGDPGLLFLERMNRDNPVSALSSYAGTPPCAEMGLAGGETCHFGYINLSKLVRSNGEHVELDYDMLGRVTILLTRVLDNAVEYSLARFPADLSRDIAMQNRKIGIGVCGLAEMLLAFGLPYDAPEARLLARDVLSFITFKSKWASVELAEQRGSCLAMQERSLNRYLNGSHLEEKYGARPTNTVTAADWEELARRIRETGHLRNITTTALPPTGRAALLVDTTSAIEPFFSIFTQENTLQPAMVAALARALEGNPQQTELLEQVCREASKAGSFQGIDVLPERVRWCLRTAKEIEPQAHIQMVADVAGLHGVTDEAASKTVNLPHETTIEDVEAVLFSAFEHGLKNIAVYRDGSYVGQPMTL